jgi:hypothetical protein
MHERIPSMTARVIAGTLSETANVIESVGQYLTAGNPSISANVIEGKRSQLQTCMQDFQNKTASKRDCRKPET